MEESKTNSSRKRLPRVSVGDLVSKSSYKSSESGLKSRKGTTKTPIIA